MRAIRNTATSRRFAVLTLALAVVVVAGCTGDDDDPRAAVRTAATELREQEGTELRLRALDGPAAGLGGDVDPDLVALADGADLVLRSSRERAVHARLDLGDDADATDAADAIGRRLSEVGLDPVATIVRSGGWLRVTNPPADGAADPLGDALGTALERLAEGADEVTDVAGDGPALEGDSGSDRVVRLTAGRELVDDLVGHLVRAADPGSVATPPPSDGDEARTTTVDVHLDDGRVTELVVPVALGDSDVPVAIAVSEPDAPHDLPTDAQPFGLRALLRDLATTAPGPGAGAGAEDGVEDGVVGQDPAPGADEEVGSEDASDDEGPDATPFREGGVLEDAFEGEDPFAETDFDCVTEDDLDNLEAALGAEARSEVEELITQGDLERC